MTTTARALDKLERLSAQPRSLVSLWDDATLVLQEVVPHYTWPCYFTLDPASLLITSHYNPFMPELPRESLAMEYYEDDVNKMSDVARSGSGLSTIHDATGGDPSGSPRWQANMVMGGDQELVAALRTRAGGVWGAVSLYREPDQPLFDAAEKQFMRKAATHLAEGARRALLFGEATDPEGPQAPGLLVLTGSSSRARRVRNSGWPSYPTPMGTGCRPRCSRSPDRPFVLRSRGTGPVRWPWPGCCPAPADGWCSTGRPWCQARSVA